MLRRVLVFAGAGAVGPVAVVRWGTTGQHGPVRQLEVLLQLLTSADGREDNTALALRDGRRETFEVNDPLHVLEPKPDHLRG